MFQNNLIETEKDQLVAGKRVAKTAFIEIIGEQIPILYEDRSVLAIDKPRGWMLAPYSWQKTNRNLQAAITSSVAAREFWARSRNLKYLRHIHRLDADTSGILLFAKTPGGLESFSRLYESRAMEKAHMEVVEWKPQADQWVCHLGIEPDPEVIGRMRVSDQGKESETGFSVLESRGGRTLVEAHPVTGRTHQIRLHLTQAGCPIVGDRLYGKPAGPADKGKKYPNLGLRAIFLGYRDPFTRRDVQIRAPIGTFLKEFGFGGPGPANPPSIPQSRPPSGP